VPDTVEQCAGLPNRGPAVPQRAFVDGSELAACSVRDFLFADAEAGTASGVSGPPEIQPPLLGFYSCPSVASKTELLVVWQVVPSGLLRYGHSKGFSGRWEERN